MNAQLKGLSEDSVQHLVAQTERLLVLASITAVAFQITTHGGADHKEKGRPEAVRGFQLFPKRSLREEGQDKQIMNRSESALRGKLVKDPFDHSNSRMALLDVTLHALAHLPVVLPV